ncbi:MAG: glutathione peroxidase [Myxococcales bacterium]|nr:glutathione peroxidase [Myxococcales bacterium]MDD9965471.1 glutathione peroxidase [Myxococcales bacterium]
MANLHDFQAKTIDGQDASLSDYSGKALLVVNVASKCGLTPHYAGLQKLQDRYADRGFSVLGFPCNQFAGQEPGTEAEIKTFCESTYAVTFPLFAKIDVNGADRHPLYGYLTEQPTEPAGPGDIKWNFEKFLVDGTGAVRARFAPPTEPDDPALVQALEALL